MGIFDKYSSFLREEDCRKLEIGKIDWESTLIKICVTIKELQDAIRGETYRIDDESPDSGAVNDLKKRLMDAREELADVLRLMSDMDFCTRIENVANEIKDWKEYELTTEEKMQDDKIIEDNRIIRLARDLDGWFVESQLLEFRKQAEGLEYKEPFPRQYPWSDIARSMLEYPKSVEFDHDKCPYCDHLRIRLLFVSPKWTWRNLMGFNGFISICMNCRRQEELKKWLRN